MRSCENCNHRAFYYWNDREYCLDYEMGNYEAAIDCKRYEEGTPDCFNEEHYCPSSTAGDYSPSNPWDAPGCSVSMFI